MTAKQVSATLFYLFVCTYYSAGFHHGITQQLFQDLILDNRASNRIAKITVCFLSFCFLYTAQCMSSVSTC